ncbi:MAG: DUF5667 domain-containing protein [Candidatus Pacebacteria bacterium]|nr:DUF5667 domain-containing protein [Candidatus Paceibacterota bacterium]
MKNKKIQLGIKEIRKIKMTEDERVRIFNKIINTPVERQGLTKSPWVSYFSFINSKSLQGMAFYLIIPLIVVFTGGAVAFASQDSLPDDILYPIKVNVLEPLGGAFKFKQESKATYQSNLASLRLSEAEVLARQDKLDREKEDKLNNLLLEHTDSFHKAIDKASKVESEERIEEIAANFRAEMNVHARILDKIAKSKNIGKKDVLEEEILIEVENKIEEFKNDDKNKETEKIEKDENKEEEDEDNDKKEEINLFRISETARLNANKVKENIIRKEREKNKEKNEIEYDEDKESKYRKKKESVEYLIEEFNKEIDSVLSEQEEEEGEVSEDDIFETLNKAKSSLEEAENKEDEGEKEEAYLRLMESEDSLREINLFLNSDLKIR